MQDKTTPKSQAKKQTKKQSWNQFYESLSPEDKIQNSCKYWTEKHRDDLLFVFIPNEGRRSQWEASRVKVLGLQKGFPDVMIISQDGRIVFFEFKTPTKKLKPHQETFIDTLETKFAQEVYVVDNKQTFISYINQIFGQ